jgi:hypothetical protein
MLPQDLYIFILWCWYKFEPLSSSASSEEGLLRLVRSRTRFSSIHRAGGEAEAVLDIGLPYRCGDPADWGELV